ncbi:TetR/AcrR family transcriptional regulator [Agromyces sp. NPDC049794]|uniref:TetR/AcrR family transcriptional regulator n=1 Tax=unclassified Agromyces TaxID=2639701 RepID=UPI0034038309
MPSIVTTAVDIADESGLAELSIRRIATRLSVSPMALYRHVDSREALVILMFDRAMGPPPPETTDATPWQDRLRVWAEALLERYTAHPWMIDAPVGGPPMTPNYARWLEQILQVLDTTGFSLRTCLEAALLVDIHLRGTAQLIGNVRPVEDGAPSPSRWLNGLLTPERFPVVARVLAAGLLDDNELDARFGLERIITGLEAIVPSRDRTVGRNE